ncbi:ABC transporter ATP-binding protein [Thioalkalivibrio sp. ALE23]|uniref:ABC transporter ATP-binding protein n=1 Tax=Thioalkalivibrio sp. ALE23 TaxID=1265495 RepID=UPI000382A957|nr:ABC transporter ATP-binding protein [Thioalkalivibrio sp. ALE23]
MSKGFLEIENLSQRFPQPDSSDLMTVFEGVDLEIQKGEFVCLIGHSGCGKSTILNVLAGLATPTDGNVIMDNKEISGPSLDQGVIFQNHSLLPWLSARDNVLFAVRARWPSWSRAQRREHAERYLKLVGLEHAMDRKPSQLSGGMRQRVGIARAFAIEPKLLLMDEPFGALDALTRGVIQEELLKIWAETRQTVFMITHDVDEAILLADRVLLMTNGPHARVAESVQIDIPRPRERASLHQHEAYYPIRNHLVDFLVHRAKELAQEAREHAASGAPARHRPQIVHPALAQAPPAAGPATGRSNTGEPAVHAV